jgi:hypothetical protein
MRYLPELSLTKNPVYHISIAWAGISCNMDDQLFRGLQSEFGRGISDIKIKVTDIKLKMGNEISVIRLA